MWTRTNLIREVFSKAKHIIDLGRGAGLLAGYLELI